MKVRDLIKNKAVEVGEDWRFSNNTATLNGDQLGRN